MQKTSAIDRLSRHNDIIYADCSKQYCSWESKSHHVFSFCHYGEGASVLQKWKYSLEFPRLLFLQCQYCKIWPSLLGIVNLSCLTFFCIFKMRKFCIENICWKILFTTQIVYILILPVICSSFPLLQVYEVKQGNNLVEKIRLFIHKVTAPLHPKVDANRPQNIKSLSHPFSREKQHLWVITALCFQL